MDNGNFFLTKNVKSFHSITQRHTLVHTDRHDQTKNMKKQWIVTSHTPIFEYIKQMDEEKTWRRCLSQRTKGDHLFGKQLG